ncbi:hypothetical protein C8R43DRAFT_1105698 [Mycena crocata]|nr:hypothetical protein C8R43DRAFT_1105698 [Mycena crocata]
MASTNFTIDNVNPLIQYSPPGAWTEGSAAADSLASSYSNNGTFTLCTAQGSSATFTFNGTQVFIFGAKRFNHGPYSVTLDGTPTLFDGFSQDPIFGPLFVSDVLKQALHTVTLTNEVTNPNNPFLDLDFITWTTATTDNGQTKTVEDTADGFTYQPSTSWSTDLSTLLLSGFSGNNGHVTSTAGASVTISFSGDIITVFGPVGPKIASYTVKTDGSTGITFNGTKQAYNPQVALYAASGLGAGQHTVEIISQPAVAGQLLAIDYVQVSPSSAAVTTSGDSSSPTGSGEKKQSSIGPAVGGAVAGIAILAILAFLIFFFLRRRRRREQDPNNNIVLEDKYPAAPGPANYTTTSLVSGPGTNGYSGSLAAAGYNDRPRAYSTHSSETHLMTSPFRDGPPPVPPIRNNNWNGSEVDYRRTFYTVNNDPSSGASSSDANSTHRASTVLSSGAAGLGAGGHSLAHSNTYASRKGQPLPMPPTANAPLPPGAERMYVPGREQDFGPLPPDYDQATEPYRGHGGS